MNNISFKYILSLVIVVIVLVLGINISPKFIFDIKYSVSWFLIFASVLIYILIYKKSKDIFHPVGLFSFIWLFTVGLANFKLSEIQTDWSLKMWLAVSFTYISFLFGYFIADYIKYRNNKWLSKGKIDSNIFIKIIYILFFICFIAFTAEVIHSGSVPIFSNSTSAYKDFGIQFVHYLTVSLSLVNYLILIYYFTYKKINASLIILFMISLSAVISLLSRQLIIFLILISVISFHYLVKKISLRYILIFTFIGLIAFTTLGNIRTNSSNYIFQVGQIKEGVNSSLFAWLYLYLGMGFENLNHYINNYNDLFFGARTFYPVFAFSLTKEFIEFDYSQFLPSQYFTVSTLIYDFYLDYGLFGVIFFSFIIGLLTRKIYINLIEKQNISYVILYSMFAHNIVFIFFVNFFSNTTWIFQLGILGVVLYILNLNFPVNRWDYRGVNK
jgi:oligosaccharide repeat unit polymerase